MPANLTPQYQKAEQQYRRAQTTEERIKCLEQMLQLIPKHKGTEKLQAELKSRLKEARAELQQERSAPKRGRSYRFPRQGAGQVVLIGAPNAGKSRILRDLSNAEPKVADFPFSTHEPMPGMMPYKDVAVQLIDTPPITETHIEPYLIGMVRAADSVLLCMNGASDDAPDETLAVVEQLHKRKTILAADTAFDEDDFSTLRVRALLVVTRASDPGWQDRVEYFFEAGGPRLNVVPVELDDEPSREKLRQSIYDSLDVIRVYTKKPGKPPDYDAPFTIPRNGTVQDLAEEIHRDLAEQVKFARVWGRHVHDGQSVGREHVLHDGDLVELHV